MVETAQAALELDVSLAVRLMHRSYQPMAAIRGLGETLLRSTKDGTMQPVAVYVPASYSPQRPAPLVIFLDGHRQAESHLLAPPYVQDLAERTGTIVVAPYGRGAFDFAGSESDVYDAFGAANAAFGSTPTGVISLDTRWAASRSSAGAASSRRLDGGDVDRGVAARFSCAARYRSFVPYALLHFNGRRRR